MITFLLFQSRMTPKLGGLSRTQDNRPRFGARSVLCSAGAAGAVNHRLGWTLDVLHCLMGRLTVLSPGRVRECKLRGCPVEGLCRQPGDPQRERSLS